jgi:hypothetical protein
MKVKLEGRKVERKIGELNNILLRKGDKNISFIGKLGQFVKYSKLFYKLHYFSLKEIKLTLVVA